MSIVQFFDPTDYITGTPSGYSLFASAAFGSNGSFSQAPELAVGGQQSATNGHFQWDEDLSDGLDSGTVGFVFNANLASGSCTFAAGEQTLSYAGSGGGTVGSVYIRAGASLPGLSKLGALQLKFYKNGVFQESVAVGSAVADASANDMGTAEQIISVSTGNAGYDQVKVSGAFRIQAGADVYPGWTDFFGEILIMPGA